MTENNLRKILWVEDEKDQFNAFSPSVKRHFHVTNCDNFEDAITTIESEKFDLYIIDIILPSGKKKITKNELINIKSIYYGIELIKYIRKSDKATPIIVLSVVNEDHNIDEIHAIDKSIDVIWKYETDIDDIKYEIDLKLS